MTDDHINFDWIKRNYQAESDFRIRVKDSNGKLLVLAPHGGGIERGTSELAKAIAGETYSFYLFEALLPKASQSKKLRIPSTLFDEPRCLELISDFQTSIAIHGCKGSEPKIIVGGRDRDLKQLLIEGLRRRGHPIDSQGKEYLGIMSSNICNRTSTGKGAQLEFSNGLRRKLFTHWQTRKGRIEKTDHFYLLVSDIREIIASFV